MSEELFFWFWTSTMKDIVISLTFVSVCLFTYIQYLPLQYFDSRLTVASSILLCPY